MRWKVLIPGLEYEISTSHQDENKRMKFTLSFLHKDRNGDVVDGITTEDLIEILIDRLQVQNRNKSDRHTIEAMYSLNRARVNLDNRQQHMRKIKFNNNKEKQL